MVKDLMELSPARELMSAAYEEPCAYMLETTCEPPSSVPAKPTIGVHVSGASSVPPHATPARSMSAVSVMAGVCGGEILRFVVMYATQASCSGVCTIQPLVASYAGISPTAVSVPRTRSVSTPSNMALPTTCHELMDQHAWRVTPPAGIPSGFSCPVKDQAFWQLSSLYHPSKV